MASFTTTSPFSGAVWDGPGTTCAIISPSNWQTQVLDNLTVLSGHNHSGSAGEGILITAASFFPAIDNDYFSPFFPVASDPDWGLSVAVQAQAPFTGNISTSTFNSSVAYDVYLRTGTYLVNIFQQVQGTGIVPCTLLNVYIGGVNAGSVTYGGGGIRTASMSVSVVGAGERQLAFYTSSETGFQPITAGASIYAIHIRRTGA